MEIDPDLVHRVRKFCVKNYLQEKERQLNKQSTKVPIVQNVTESSDYFG
jgi:hypothetical protein